ARVLDQPEDAIRSDAPFVVHSLAVVLAAQLGALQGNPVDARARVAHIVALEGGDGRERLNDDGIVRTCKGERRRGVDSIAARRYRGLYAAPLPTARVLAAVIGILTVRHPRGSS